MEKPGTTLAAFGVLAAFISSLAYFGFIYDSYQLAKATALVLCLLVLCAALFLSPGRYEITPLSAAAFFLCAYTLFSSFFTPYKPGFFYTLTLLCPLLFIFVSRFGVNTGLFLTSVNAALLLSSAFGITQFITGLYRPYSFFGNPIFFAEFTAACLPLALASFFLYEKQRPLIAANIILALAALLTASSRGAFISFGVSLAFFSFFAARAGAFAGLKPFFKKYLPALAILCVLVLAAPGFSHKLKSNASRLAEFASMKSEAVENRLLMSRASLDIFKTSPVTGAGAGAVSYLYQKHQAPYLADNPGLKFVKTSYVHNDWVHTLAEFGLIGFVLLVSFVFLVFRAFDASSAAFAKEKYIFTLGVISSFLLLCTEAFFNFPLYVLPSAALFWILAGIIAFSCGPGRLLGLSIPSKAAAVLLLLLILPALWAMPRELASNFWMKKGFIEHSKRTNFEIDYLSKAYEINKNNYYTQALLGFSYSKIDRYEEAASWYEKALELRPNSADMLYNLGANLRSAGRADEAEAALLSAINLYPYFPEANMTLGKLYIDRGEEEKGLYYFSQAKKSSAYFDFDMMNTVLDFRETTQ